MRRRQASSHSGAGGGKPLPGAPHSFAVVPDGRIQLTPTGSGLANGGGGDDDDFSALASAVYEEASTPTLGGAPRRKQQSARSAPAMMRAPSSFSRAPSYMALGSSRRLPMNGMAASMAFSGSASAPAKPPLSARAIAVLNFVADMIFSLCLVVAAAGRANFVSFYYLLVFCYGVVYSFQSRPVTLVTLLVSLLACAGHAAAIFLFKSAPGASMTTAESIADLFGFSHVRDAKDYVVAFIFDGLVLAASAVHFFYTLRRLEGHRNRLDQHQQEMNDFDFFEMGEQLFNHGGDARRDRKRSLLQGLEALCAILLLVAAVAVPAFAPAVYYLLLIERLVRYTVFTKKVTLKELATRPMAANAAASTASRPTAATRLSDRSSVSTFLGLRATRVLLLLNVLFTSLWYVILVCCHCASVRDLSA